VKILGRTLFLYSVKINKIHSILFGKFDHRLIDIFDLNEHEQYLVDKFLNQIANFSNSENQVLVLFGWVSL
jgi:hypothetical protein